MVKFKKIFIVTDGASRGNPGPSAIGYGIYDQEWTPLEERAEYIGRATNNEAEYCALLAALERAARFSKDEVEHLSDSELLVRQLNGQYQVRAVNLKPLFDKVAGKKSQFRSVRHRHVPRTSRHVQKIDLLVNETLDGAGH